MPIKVSIVKAMVFPVVMYGCESWTIKKAEWQRIDGFELWCWRRLWRVPWTARRSNQLILKEISPKCSLKGLMLKLKLQYFYYLMWRADSLEKTFMLGKIEGRRRRGWHRMIWLNGITDLIIMSLYNLKLELGVGAGQGSMACCSPRGHKELDQTDWTELNHVNGIWKTCNGSHPWVEKVISALSKNEDIINTTMGAITCAPPSCIFVCGIGSDPPTWGVHFLDSWKFIFSDESVLHIRWPNYSSFSVSISPSNEYSRLIYCRMEWLDLLAVQGTLKSLLQHHRPKASILRCSAFFIVQLSRP